MGELFQADEELQVWILLDRFDRLAISKPQAFFHQQRSERGAGRHDRLTEVLAQPLVVDRLGQLPRNEPRQLHSAILRVEVTAEGKVKVGELELLTLLFAVHPVTGVREAGRNPTIQPQASRSQMLQHRVAGMVSLPLPNGYDRPGSKSAKAT